MTAFSDIRLGLNRAWETLSEGWQELRSRTAGALTHFSHGSGGDLETAQQQVAIHGPRWGLLTADVHETDEQVTVRIEIPGMDKDDFDISVHDGRALVISGEKRAERERTRGRYHIIESAYGRFERTVALPSEVNEEGTRATYRRGVLKVTLPKSGGTRQRIQVRGE